GRRDVERAGAPGDVDPRMVASRLPAIDPLRTEAAGNPPFRGPDEGLSPALAARIHRARRADPLQLGPAASHELRARHIGGGRGVDILDLPGAGTDDERAFDRA